MPFWLMKSEPDVYGIDDLKRDRRTCWEGVRNYQVRNMMRDDMRKGDLAFFYHSNCKRPGIYGTMKIVREAYTDHFQFDPDSKYYDPKSDPDDPRWLMVDVGYQRKFRHPVTLEDLRQEAPLEDMLILRRGNRLSVTPVSDRHWTYILGLV